MLPTFRSSLWVQKCTEASHWRSYLLPRRQYVRKAFDPLRILFCGSDDFSIASLEALHKESENKGNFIESIDVVCRPGKWTGPSRKTFKEVPITRTARLLGLPLHQIDTFTGWTPPPTDLIIAVSFGLLVPRRLIEGATYGGLNVHPSLLPDLHGPAPLDHALLHGDTHTGITIQTLHPTKMDAGRILAQTPPPGIPIPHPNTMTIPELRLLTAPLGAALLIHSLCHALFLPPTTDLTTQATQSLVERGRTPRHARKLDIEDRHIDWRNWSSAEIVRRQRLLGPLWSNLTVPVFDHAGRQTLGTRKVVWSAGFEVVDPYAQEGRDASGSSNSGSGSGSSGRDEGVAGGGGDNATVVLPDREAEVQPGMPVGHAYAAWDKSALLVNTTDGMALKAREMTVAGGKRGG
ncbi:MAG: hypothetical protein LQ340_003490, partial [Diploschistes diacapsis]